MPADFRVSGDLWNQLYFENEAKSKAMRIQHSCSEYDNLKLIKFYELWLEAESARIIAHPSPQSLSMLSWCIWFVARWWLWSTLDTLSAAVRPRTLCIMYVRTVTMQRLLSCHSRWGTKQGRRRRPSLCCPPRPWLLALCLFAVDCSIKRPDILRWIQRRRPLQSSPPRLKCSFRPLSCSNRHCIDFFDAQSAI